MQVQYLSCSAQTSNFFSYSSSTSVLLPTTVALMSLKHPSLLTDIQWLHKTERDRRRVIFLWQAGQSVQNSPQLWQRLWSLSVLLTMKSKLKRPVQMLLINLSFHPDEAMSQKLAAAASQLLSISTSDPNLLKVCGWSTGMLLTQLPKNSVDHTCMLYVKKELYELLFNVYSQNNMLLMAKFVIFTRTTPC